MRMRNCAIVTNAPSGVPETVTEENEDVLRTSTSQDVCIQINANPGGTCEAIANTAADAPAFDQNTNPTASNSTNVCVKLNEQPELDKNFKACSEKFDICVTTIARQKIVARKLENVCTVRSEQPLEEETTCKGVAKTSDLSTTTIGSSEGEYIITSIPVCNASIQKMDQHFILQGSSSSKSISEAEAAKTSSILINNEEERKGDNLLKSSNSEAGVCKVNEHSLNSNVATNSHVNNRNVPDYAESSQNEEESSTKEAKIHPVGPIESRSVDPIESLSEDPIESSTKEAKIHPVDIIESGPEDPIESCPVIDLIQSLGQVDAIELRPADLIQSSTKEVKTCSAGSIESSTEKVKIRPLDSSSGDNTDDDVKKIHHQLSDATKCVETNHKNSNS